MSGFGTAAARHRARTRAGARAVSVSRIASPPRTIGCPRVACGARL